MTDTECPTCGRSDFASSRTMKIHHTKEHGESLRMTTVDCDNCGVTFEKRSDRAQGDNFCSKECSLQKPRVGVEGEKINSEEWIRNQYWEKGKSAHQIANEVGVSERTVYNRMEKFSIERRDDYQKFYGAALEPSELRRCVEEGLKPNQIADYLNCSLASVTRWCERLGLNPKSTTPTELTDEEWLREKYIEEKKNIGDIADLLEVHPVTVYRWRKHHGIESQGVQGEYNRHWKGGIGSGGYGENWDKQRQKRLEIDDFECVVCGIQQDQHLEKYGVDLSVHHITPIRDFDSPEKANELSNLMTVCRSCHRKWEGIPLRPESSKFPV